MKSTDTLWTVAKEATAHVKRENGDKGGLAFWSRMYADKTMFEAMGQETPSFNPPFTVSLPHLLPTWLTVMRPPHDVPWGQALAACAC